MEIRRAQKSDAVALGRLICNELGYPVADDALPDRLGALLEQGDALILVAEEVGRVVGFVHAQDYNVLYMPDLKNILAIAVDGECRRRGVGRALMQGVERWARETGAVGIRLVSGENREQAHDFYTAYGFDFRKTQKNFILFFED